MFFPLFVNIMVILSPKILDMYKVMGCLEWSPLLRQKWNHNKPEIRIWAISKYAFYCTLQPSIQIGISCIRVSKC